MITPAAWQGLLELARLLQLQTPRIGVQLVAYASEEPPFFRSDEMGSAVHAASLERPVKLMIALEMIGYYDSTPRSRLPIPGNVLGFIPIGETLLPWSAECRISTPFVR